MNYGLSIPNFGDYADPSILAAVARDAEAAGWDGLFLWDHIQFWKGFDGAMGDPWVLLTVAAMSTTRMRLGTLVTPLARRRPWKLARETVTLDHLSGGRLVLGVGLGFPPDAEFAQFGEETDGRVRAEQLDEGLEVLTGLWRGEPFSFAGTHYRLDGAVFRPPPVQRPRIPVWVAGMWPNRAPFRRAARWDGVAPIGRDQALGQMLSPDDLREVVAYTMRRRPAQAGSFDVVFGGATPGDDAAKAGDIVAPYADAGLTWWVENVNPWRGPFDQMQVRVRQGPPHPR